MNTRYWWAVGLAVIGFGAIALMLLNPDVPNGLLIVAAAALPLAVLFAIQGKLGKDAPLRAIVGGAVIGGVVAVLAYGLVFTLAYAFVGGFADTATEILDALGVDPALTEALGTQWLIVLAISTVVVAPITEEIFFRGFLLHRWERSPPAWPRVPASPCSRISHMPSAAACSPTRPRSLSSDRSVPRCTLWRAGWLSSVGGNGVMETASIVCFADS